MPLVVLCGDGRMRQALCAIAEEEGLQVEPVASIHEYAARHATGGPTVVLIEAIRDADLARAFLPLAEWGEVRVGLICGNATSDLAHHECVRHVLSAPFTASALRIFLSDIARGHRATRASHTRLRAIPGVAKVEDENPQGRTKRFRTTSPASKT